MERQARSKVSSLKSYSVVIVDSVEVQIIDHPLTAESRLLYIVPLRFGVIASI